MTDNPSVEPTEEQMQRMGQAMMQAPNVLKMYANGFLTAQSPSDISLILTHNNAPVGVLTLSFITAKSIVDQVGKSLDNIEKKTGTKIKTMDEIAISLGMAKATV